MIRASAAGLSLLVGLLGCAGSGTRQPEAPLRISELAEQGDPARRASLRMVQDGLLADGQSDPRRAQSRYERAIQIDPTNPFAYLALARLHIERGDPWNGLSYLDRSEVLMSSEGPLSPRVESHLLGLRGAALVALGRPAEGEPLLADARQLAPQIWEDGRLAADELR